MVAGLSILCLVIVAELHVEEFLPHLVPCCRSAVLWVNLFLLQTFLRRYFDKMKFYFHRRSQSRSGLIETFLKASKEVGAFVFIAAWRTCRDCTRWTNLFLRLGSVASTLRYFFFHFYASVTSLWKRRIVGMSLFVSSLSATHKLQKICVIFEYADGTCNKIEWPIRIWNGMKVENGYFLEVWEINAPVSG